jgi:hypothetical protein
MKRILAGLLLAAASFAAFGQSAIVRGEQVGNAGTYLNIQSYNISQDANTASIIGLANASYGMLFNGTTWDRVRTNFDTQLISCSGCTTTQVVGDQTNYNGRGVIVTLNMTVVGTGSVTVNVQGRDAFGNYYTLLQSAAIVTNIFTVLTVYPGNTVAANVSASTVVPRLWRVQVIANNANATTYTVSSSIVN